MRRITKGVLLVGVLGLLVAAGGFNAAENSTTGTDYPVYNNTSDLLSASYLSLEDYHSWTYDNGSSYLNDSGEVFLPLALSHYQKPGSGQLKPALCRDIPDTDGNIAKYDFNGDNEVTKSCSLLNQMNLCNPSVPNAPPGSCDDAGVCDLSSVDLCVAHDSLTCSWLRDDWWAPRPLSDGSNDADQTTEEYPPIDFEAGTCVSAVAWSEETNSNIDGEEIFVNWRPAARAGLPQDRGLDGWSIKITEDRWGSDDINEINADEDSSDYPAFCPAEDVDPAGGSVTDLVTLASCVWTASPKYELSEYANDQSETQNTFHLKFKIEPKGTTLPQINAHGLEVVINCRTPCLGGI